MLNEKSFNYVKNQLLYLGFGDEIAQPLRDKMEHGLTAFTLPHVRRFGQDETHSVLHFSMGDQKDVTFFNRFEVTLKQPDKEALTQTFFVGREYNYTLQERYNMMDGRAVYREQPRMIKGEENGQIKMIPTGETYLGWKGLNFRESDRHGNFLPKTMFWDHQKELARYPVKERSETYDYKRLLAALEKGNKTHVTILQDGQEIKGTIAANPRMQRFDFYDAAGQSLVVRPAEKQQLAQTAQLSQTESKELKQDKKQAQQQEPDDTRQKNNTTQRRKQGMHI
jgi:hypothetical protein